MTRIEAHLNEFEALLSEFPINSAQLKAQWMKAADLRHRLHESCRLVGQNGSVEKWQRQLRAIALALGDFHRAVKHCEDDTDPDDDIPF